MRYFCTYFDHRFLAQGLALHESLSRHCPQFKLWVLCLDSQTYESLHALNLPGIQPIELEHFESNDETLRQAKTNRSILEYYFTCTPSLPLFVLRNNPAVDLITYLDADLFFFSTVEPLFDEIAGHSIAIIAHRFPAAFREAERFGIFNVGWVTFRRDHNGLECLQWWREQCIGWCSDQSDGGRFADQKYLDDWPTRFQNVVVLQHKGANLAPWNLVNFDISVRSGRIQIDDEPLIFFHFHGLKQLNGYVYGTQLEDFGCSPSRLILRNIYTPYIRTITSLAKQLKAGRQATDFPPLRRKRENGDEPRPSIAARGLTTIKHLLKRHYFVVLNGRIL